MNILGRLRVRTKLALLMSLSVLAVVVLCAVATSMTRQRMMDDRIDKLRALVLTARGFATALDGQVRAGRLSHDQAMAEFRDQLHLTRYGAETDYFLAQTDDGMVVIHGGDPAREGKPTTATDDQGRSSAQLAREVLRGADGGAITYSVAKPGQAASLPKLSYVARFEPWRLVFISGSWIDDIEAAYHATLGRLIGIGGAVMIATALLAWLIDRDIAGPLGKLKAAMIRLSEGDLDVPIPGTRRRDEVGAMANSLLVFKQHMAREAGSVVEREKERQQAAEAGKRAALAAMADNIEAETDATLKQVRACTDAMTATAGAMQVSAGRTRTAAETAAVSAGQALANAQSVAGAAEELSASIRAMGGQATESTAVVSRAVEAAAETRRSMEALHAQVGKIGAVADMIGEIAAKTNLLALNATIEAARAGDAGKGFAVVASEVKALATQTARSTQEIGQLITEVRTATKASVAAVGRIENTIAEVNGIADSIVAAVEQQGLATAEIARNVTETAAAANQMTDRVSDVSSEAAESDRRATNVRDNADALTTAMEGLRHSVIRVVRTSTTEVDRREDTRHPVDRACRVSAPGHQVEVARIVDLSLGGAGVDGGPPLPVGAQGTLTVDGIGTGLPFSVRAADDGALHVAFALDPAAREALATALEQASLRRAA